jgi:hypothetical protein
MNLPASEYMNVIDIVTGAMLPSLLDEGYVELWASQ